MNLLKKRIDECVQLVNRQNSVVFVFLVLCFNFLSFELNSNEEQYLALAKQFFQPNWLPGSFSLTEFPGTRLIFQIITGFLLQYFTFEQVTFVGRLLNFLLFALPLAKLMKLFSIKNLLFLFAFQLFYFPHQSFFADEWIFKGFEAKTIAYFFVFYSIYYLLKNNYWKSTLLTLIATYFHVLVGGWFFLASVLYLFFSRGMALKKLTKIIGLYVLLSLPFLAYLSQEILLNTATEINGVNLDWIYVFFRAPHHVGLFGDIIIFFREHLPGIMLSMSFFLICLLYGRKLNENYLLKLNQFNIIIFSVIFTNLIVGFFDQTGFFLKYYPYRISAISLLLVVIELSAIAIIVIKEKYLKTIYGGLLLIAIPVFVYSAATNIYVMANPKDALLNEMTAFVESETQPKDKFLFINYEKDIEHVSFFRKAERERFVVYKFVPSGGNKLYEWYTRILEKEKVEDDIQYLFTLKNKYELNYLVSPSRHSHPQLDLVFENPAYHVYQIK